MFDHFLNTVPSPLLIKQIFVIKHKKKNTFLKFDENRNQDKRAMYIALKMILLYDKNVTFLYDFLDCCTKSPTPQTPMPISKHCTPHFLTIP
jgi:hypothetical protein